MELNLKMLSIGTAAFTVLNILWVYLYSLVGLNFTQIYNPVFFLDLAKDLSWVPVLLLTGAVLAAAIFVARLFASYLAKNERLLMVAIGGVIPLAIGLAIYSNLIVFSVTMVFYILGCVLAIGLPETELKGALSKMGSGYSVSKTVINLVAIGSLVASLIFFYSNLEDSQTKFKEGIVGIQSQLNIGSFISKDDVKQMVGGSITDDQLRQQAATQIGNSIGKTADEVLADPTYTSLIETAVANAKSSIDQTVDDSYSKMVNSSSNVVGPLLESMLSKPPLKYLIDFMPLLSAIIIASLVSSFGMVWVGPINAVLGVSIPNKQEPKK